jgi:hypothetical protein
MVRLWKFGKVKDNGSATVLFCLGKESFPTVLSSVSDPDPDPPRRAKMSQMTHKNRKK